MCEQGSPPAPYPHLRMRTCVKGQMLRALGNGNKMAASSTTLYDTCEQVAEMSGRHEEITIKAINLFMDRKNGI